MATVVEKEPRLYTDEQMAASDASMYYKRDVIEALKLSFPNLYEDDIIRAVDYSIAKRSKDARAKLTNKYTDLKSKSTLFRVTEYILSRQPIITVAGVMFKKHGDGRNPYVDLIQEFLQSRNAYKKEMFKYPKGSEEFEKYNLLQLSEKRSGNAIYGASGAYTSIFYNLHVAQSITMQGRSCIAAAIALFESTMANNVKFTSLNDVTQFIVNVCKEDRKYADEEILDGNVSVEECFFKIVYSCGFYWNPTERELQIVWDMLNQCSQIWINRIFYKNNLYWFVENKVVMNRIIQILSKLDTAFMDPNDIPEVIKDDMEELYNLIYEFVYYDKQYLDRIDRAENMYRCVSVLTDTDSCFISFDGWFRFILEKTYNIPMEIKTKKVTIVNKQTGNEEIAEFEIEPADELRFDYDFYTDEIIEQQEFIHPDTIQPQVAFRCSIVNILASIMGRLAIDYMSKYSENSNTLTKYDGSRRVSFFILKNEFQLKRALVTFNKKNYCSFQERQEANLVPAGKVMDIKGMPITKVGLPEVTKQRMKNILFDLVLNNGGNVSQVQIIKQLAIFEKQIMLSILAGDKTFFKPFRIKSERSYTNPLRTGGIKSAIAWNQIRLDSEPAFDLNERNSILVICVKIGKPELEKIKEECPERYRKITDLLATDAFKNGLNKIAIDENWETPEWLKEYIDYTTIINSNLKVFPCEALGIDRKDKSAVNYTNIITIE